MGLQLVEGRLDLPTLRVRSGEFGGGDLVGVEDRGEQPKRAALGAAAVFNGLVDDAHDHVPAARSRVGDPHLTQP